MLVESYGIVGFFDVQYLISKIKEPGKKKKNLLDQFVPTVAPAHAGGGVAYSKHAFHQLQG